MQRVVCKVEEESRHVEDVSMNKRSGWTRWEDGQEKALWSGRSPGAWEDTGTSFLCVLSTMSCLLHWTSTCRGWQNAPAGEGQPTFSMFYLSVSQVWHDQIVTLLAAGAEMVWCRNQNDFLMAFVFFQFLMSGESTVAETWRKGVLAVARRWEMRAELKKQPKLPEEISYTSLRPNTVLWSGGAKQKVLIQLTEPWE